jgi:aryl-alcohol dehydrogenase
MSSAVQTFATNEAWFASGGVKDAFGNLNLTRQDTTSKKATTSERAGADAREELITWSILVVDWSKYILCDQTSSMETTAAILREPSARYSLEQVTIADPGPGQVLVRVAAVGHCHTDLLPRTGMLPIPMPMIAGHEGAGVVEAVGDGVTSLVVGDHVVMSFGSCGGCPPCVAGLPASCDLFAPMNLFGAALDGSVSVTDTTGAAVSARWFSQSSFAMHALAFARNAVKIDRDLPLELMAPLGCGLQTGAGTVLNVLKPAPGDSIAVFGTGAVGSAAIMAAAAAGCTTIVAIDLHPHRLELAKSLGATHVVDGRADDVGAQVMATTGRGVDHAVDTTGVNAVCTAAISALTSRGTLALVGVAQPDLVIPGNALAMGKRIVGVIEGDSDPQTFIPQLAQLWRDGKFPIERLVQTFPFAEIDHAEAEAAAGRVVKPVLLM